MAAPRKLLGILMFLFIAAFTSSYTQSANAQNSHCDSSDSTCFAEIARVIAIASPCTRLPNTKHAQCFREAAIKSRSLGICEELKENKQACVAAILEFAQRLQREDELSGHSPEGNYRPRLSLQYYEIKMLASQDKEVQLLVEQEQSKVRNSLLQNCGQGPRSYNEYIECVARESVKANLGELCRSVFNAKDEDYAVFSCEKLGHPEWCNGPTSNHFNSYWSCQAVADYLIQNDATQCLSKSNIDGCYTEVTATLFRKDSGLNTACSLARDPAQCYQRAAAWTKNISPCLSFENEFSSKSKWGFPGNIPVNQRTYESSALKHEVQSCIQGALLPLAHELMDPAKFLVCLNQDAIYQCILKIGSEHRSTKICTWYNQELKPQSFIAENHIGANDLAESCIWDIARTLADPSICLDNLTQPYLCMQGIISISTSSDVCSKLPDGRDRQRCYARVPFSMRWIIAVVLWLFPALLTYFVYLSLSKRAGFMMVRFSGIALIYVFLIIVAVFGLMPPIVQFAPFAPYYSFLDNLALGEAFKFQGSLELICFFAIHISNIMVIAIWLSMIRNRRLFTALVMLSIVVIASLLAGGAGTHSLAF